LARSHTLAPGALQEAALLHGNEAELSEDDLSQDEDLDNMFDEDEEDDTANIPEESKISKILSDQTTKTVIILVLCLLFCLPAFTVETYMGDTVMLHDQALKHLGSIYNYGSEYYSDYQTAFKHFEEVTTGEG